MFPARVPWIVRTALRGAVWNVPTHGKVLYLTFDDGPVPEVTPWVLDTLAQFDAKATFFCIGRNCVENPEILARILGEGHEVGNHTWDHPRGRSTPFRSYLRNVLMGEDATGSKLFRPPYGSLTCAQYRAIQKRYNVVLWDVLSADYDQRITGTRCLERVIHGARPGSIIVFHDSVKAARNLRFALPRALENFTAQGYEFRALTTAPLG